MMIGDKERNIVALCRSRRQNKYEFESFSKILQKTLDKLVLDNTFIFLFIGDLNAKSKNWCSLERSTYVCNILNHYISFWPAPINL